MKSSPSMHLPKEDGNTATSPIDFDFEDVLKSITTPSGSPDKPKRLVCPECQQRGQESYLCPYQINFEEAMYLCPIMSCVYPMKEENLIQRFIFKRDVSTLPAINLNNPRKKIKSSGYSEFFEDFDFDSFFDFSIPGTVQPDASMGNSSNMADNKSLTSAKPAAYREQLLVETNTQETSISYVETQNLAPLAGENMPSHGVMENYEIPKASQLAEEKSVPPLTSDISASVEMVEQDLLMDNIHFPEAMNTDEDLEIIASVLEDKNAAFSFDEATPQKFSHPPFGCKMIQWTNSENSCWLDAIMQVLVSSSNARAVLNVAKLSGQSILKNLFATYDKCQLKYQEHLSNAKNSEQEMVTSVLKDLSSFRKYLLEILMSSLPLKRGEFQSLLEMFPLVLKADSSIIDNFFKVHLLWNFQCDDCGHKRARRSDGEIVSFPHTLSDFHPLNAQFRRPCYECGSSRGLTTMYMEKLPPCLAFHFQRGLPHSNLRVLDFAVQGLLYSVFALVQYVLTPFKHFITWVRDVRSSKWLCCDDLKAPVCTWQSRQPNIPPNEIHMVFWERQLLGDPMEVRKEHLLTVVNDEAAEIGEDIPVELFFAHEDEAIVIEDEGGAGCSAVQSTVPVRQVPYHSSVERTHLKVEQCPATSQQSMQLALAPTSNVLSAVANGLDSTVLPSQLQMNGQLHNGHMSVISPSPGGAMHVSGVAQGSYKFDPSMFVNGGLTVIPNSNGKQAIQLMAPENTCSIFIVTGDNKNQQTMPLYHGTPDSRQTALTKSMPCSFINNPHSYNMVAQGPTKMAVQGSIVNSNVRRNMVVSKRPKRQYKLAGYPMLHSSKHFTPMKVVAGAKSSVNASDAKSEKSFNSKSDSETLSEISELSDLLPDFDTGGSRRAPIAARTRSLYCNSASAAHGGL